MVMAKIGVSDTWRVAQRIERIAAAQGHDTFTTAKQGRYIVRTDLNNGKYVRTVVESNEEGIAVRAYSQLMRKADKLKAKIKSFIVF